MAYFTLLSELLKTNPPTAADAPEVAKFAKIGLVPGKDFDVSKFNPDFGKHLPQVGFDRIMAASEAQQGDHAARWMALHDEDRLVWTDYLMRAFLTAVGLGANRPQDAIYPMSTKDAAGDAYDGAHKYVMHFPKGQLPPVHGFWSLTMYDDEYFFVANPINRYSISPRQKSESEPRRLRRSLHPE